MATVSTRHGRVAGSETRGVHRFLGIPYAAPPVGRRRFRAPEAPEPWDGDRPALEFGPVAPQTRPAGTLGTLFAAPPHLVPGDDCLSLNVWSPDLGDARLPVLIWIHGGGFASGSGASSLYDGATFARDGVVCVTFNHRLGAAGYLFTGEDGAGNFGTLDQLAAISWVRENIAAFGGDPERITLAGESAGGVSVAVGLAAPAGRDLCRRAIAQSGSACLELDPDVGSQMAELFFREAGIVTGDVEALRALESARILEVQQAAVATLMRERARSTSFYPVWGGDVLPRPVLESIESGSAAGVDLLIGHTRDEFRLFFVDPAAAAAITEPVLPALFEGVLPGRGEAALARYRAHRPGASPVELAAALHTDRMFRVPALRTADAQSHHATTYFYRFDWPSNAFDGAIGAAHSVELPFMWNTLDDSVAHTLTGGDAPQALADDMHRSWVAFVTSGSPAHTGLPDWPAYDAETRPTMAFGAVHRLERDPDDDERRLWYEHAAASSEAPT